MPDPKAGESRDDFLERCIPQVLEEGTAEGREQAVAICSSMYREGQRKALVMKMTKVQRLQNGRVRWQARANTGEFDLVQERFSQAFFDDIVANFYRAKEALSRGDSPPAPMTEPILDISHYSIYIADRNLARAGWIDKTWRDGRVLFAQGYFDNDTRLGQLAAKAAMERKPEDRRVSIVVYPDYRLVRTEAGGERRVYDGEGGGGSAWLDSIAMTSRPCDPGAIMEVKSMSKSLKDDALQVLGDEATESVEELEQARTAAKTAPDGVLIKAEDAQGGETVSETDELAETPEVVEEEVQDEPAVEEEAPEAEPQEEAVTMSVLKGVLGEIAPQIKGVIDETIAPLNERLDAVDAKIAALAEDEAEKVKAALDTGGDWFTELMRSHSVQRAKAVKGEDGEVKGPKKPIDQEYASWLGEKQ